MKHTGNLLLARGLERLDAPLLFLVARSRLRFVRAADAEKGPVDGNVNVLGETLDDIEYFRQRGAALENQVPAHLRQPKQFVERPAHPEVLFDNDRIHPAGGGRLYETSTTILGTRLGEG